MYACHYVRQDERPRAERADAWPLRRILERDVGHFPLGLEELGHPVTVRKVKRHYETARGFNSLAVARSICPDDHLFTVIVSDQSVGELLKLAVFDLAYTTLLYSGISTKQRQKAYWVLKDLFAEMRAENIPIPAELTKGSVRRMLRLSTNQTKQPRVRHSELARTLDGS